MRRKTPNEKRGDALGRERKVERERGCGLNGSFMRRERELERERGCGLNGSFMRRERKMEREGGRGFHSRREMGTFGRRAESGWMAERQGRRGDQLQRLNRWKFTVAEARRRNK